MDFERKIVFSPAFDKRDPDPKKNYGIHGVTMHWYLKGDKGVIQFVIYTNWQLPHVWKEQDQKPCDPDPDYRHFMCRPMPADIGYHSPKPMYEGQEPIRVSCDVLDGKTCYYDGSSLNADPIFDLLVKEGGEAVWKEMERYYHQTFEEDSQ